MSSEHTVCHCRGANLDNQDHVYHAEYLTLLGQARTAWLHTCLGGESPDEYVIAHIDIDFLNELSITTSASGAMTAVPGAVGVQETAAVDVVFAIKRLGDKSLTTEEVMTTPDGVKIARASTILLMWNRATRRTRALSKRDRDLVAPCRVTTGSEE